MDAAEDFEKRMKTKILAMRMKFVQDKLSLVNALEGELTEENIHKAQILGHQVKGSAATFNFENLSILGEKIETAAKNQQLVELKNGLVELKSLLEAVQE